jgi:predicted dehydrogenase
MSAVAILGSGFGLYGYLPALVACGHRVILPARYCERFEQREELRPYAPHVTWAEDELTAIRAATGVVLALCPAMQQQWLTRCLEQPNVQRLLLEKPLAPDPRMAATAHHWLMNCGKAFGVSYLFRYLDWSADLRSATAQSDQSAEVFIDWHFGAHHYKHNVSTWKRCHNQGGGAIRFYGIHLIALLAELGYTGVAGSESFGVSHNDVCRWRATFTGNDVAPCTVNVDSWSAEPRFSIKSDYAPENSVVVDLTDPFAETQDVAPHSTFPSVDRRVDVLTRFCQAAWNSGGSPPAFYGAMIELWRQLEAIDRWHVVRAVA